VQNVATPHKLLEPVPLARRNFSPAVALTVLFVGALWLGLCRELSSEWTVNEQYSFGWFVPFFALYLFWLRWQDRPSLATLSERKNTTIIDSRYRTERTAALTIGFTSLLSLLPLRLLEIANPEWRLLAWIHALAVITLTLCLLWWTGGKVWLRHFAFPVAFILVAVPWPIALELPVIQGLMRIVARVAAETAMLLGTPAEVEGNLIRVSNGLVGVNEACSGIRSLQTSLMIGLLFGEVKRLCALRRATLVVCAVVVALLANFVRAVFLVHIAATENLSEVSRWHDIAGYSIILFVFVFTMLLAHLLGHSTIGHSKSEIKREAFRTGRATIPIVYVAAALCWLLFVEIGTAGWYRFHERNLISGMRWNVEWPETATNFRKLKIDNEIRAILRFDEGDAASWTSTAPASAIEPNPIACSLYFLRWNPGKNSALLANLHRPDVCLPASGWKQIADHGVRSYRVNGSVELPFRHFEFQRTFDGSAIQTAHAFYCLSEDQVSRDSASPDKADSVGMFGSRSEWTRSERLGAVLKGRRHLGQQVVEAIFISSGPESAAEAETHMTALIPHVIRLRNAR
jgi:exosortase